LKRGRAELAEAIAFVKSQPGTEYMDLQGRKLVDAAIMLIVGHLFLQQSVAEPRRQDAFTTQPAQGGNGDGIDRYRQARAHKAVVARRYIRDHAAQVTMLCRQILRGDRSSMTDYEAVVGPVPVG